MLWEELSNDAKSIIEWMENPITNQKHTITLEKNKKWSMSSPNWGKTPEVMVTNSVFSEIKKYVIENHDIRILTSGTHDLSFKEVQRVIYIDNTKTSRTVDFDKAPKEGDEIELYEFSGGHILARILSIEGDNIYTRKIRSVPSL